MHYIKLKLWLANTPNAKPKSDSIVLEFLTEEEALEFQKSVNHATGIPMSCDFGNDTDGFETYSVSMWQMLTRIPVKIRKLGE